ncbi:MAG: serine/threonine-protein kinase [Planctomycetota bacterium]|nr:serine/threonine-protein kinase [Planctomycetota bacterium]
MESETRVLARLVRRGVLPEDVVRDLIERAQEADDDEMGPASLAIEEGLVDEEQMTLFLQTDGEEAPQLPKGLSYAGKLGEGGTAHVFRVNRRGSQPWAAKVLKPDFAENPSEVRAFLAEAKLLQRLDHPNVLRGFKSGRLDGWYVSFSQLLEGGTLQEHIGEEGALEEDLALSVILQVSRALEYLREHGVVHRDIKPGNIMLLEDDHAVLIDLGFAAEGGGEDEADETTRGTAAYLSPEQARGEGDLDVRSDIYSLGATLYQLVIGELPFTGDDEDLVRAAVLERLSAERTKGGGLSQYMHYFIEKMMAKDREHRYQDPAELASDIEAHMEGRADLTSSEPSPEEEESERARRRLDRLRRKRQRRQ